MFYSKIERYIQSKLYLNVLMLYVANDLSICAEGASAHLLANAFWDRLLASVIFYDIYLYRKRICKNSLGICQYPYVFTLDI